MREAVRGAMNGVATEPSELAIGERTLLVTARPLPDGGAVIAVMDLTTRRRLETIRRDFVANVSHELKTPLTVIGGFAETLRDLDLPSADRERFLSTIESNTRRMQRIVDDLLDLSRYESGSWVPNVVSNDLDGRRLGRLHRHPASGRRKGHHARIPGADVAHGASMPTRPRSGKSSPTSSRTRFDTRRAGRVTVSAESPARRAERR